MYWVNGLTSIDQVSCSSDVSRMLLLIIKTRPICMFRYMSHTIYLRIQVERGWLLETDRDRRIMFRMVSCMPGIMVQEYLVLSWNIPLGTGSYYMLAQEVTLSNCFVF